LLAFLSLAAFGLWAAPPETTPYNPQPADGDLVLPMPGGAEMVFRPVTVPGKPFWGSAERIVQLGDSGGGAFEGVQRTLVSGSFPDAERDGWLIWLAKYELTRGQYVAVMGPEALAKASGDPDDQGYAALEGRKLRQAQAMPLAWVSHQAVEDFVRAYNRWLFDPSHPERLSALPVVDGVPGFLRLATEEEWEFAARGGPEAVRDGSFDERLPFSPRALNEHAWHLGNARNRPRPVGLRKPNPLGFHDLFGNVHEMTAGVFRPELRQGKPGGIPVRGPSVSSPASDVRASYRTELDAYAWDAETAQMTLRRTFNIGARLAIGANVVVSAATRAALEQEYADYRRNLRQDTPVGKSLDNLVSQASSQLATVDEVLLRLRERYPDAGNQLEAIQGYVDNARERLHQAQRESARSQLQDAARNGTNLSVLISKRSTLETAIATARKLLEMSTRYQSQVDSVQRSLDENAAAAGEQYKAYLEKVQALGDYQGDYREHAFKVLAEKRLSAREARVLELLGRHVGLYNETRKVETEAWREEFESVFNAFNE
jgi:hypothetical protein